MRRKAKSLSLSLSLLGNNSTQCPAAAAAYRGAAGRYVTNDTTIDPFVIRE